MFDAALIAGLNHLLGGAQWARTRLAPFSGRKAVIDMPPFRFALGVEAEGRFEPAPDSTVPDVTIHLPADTPFLMPQGLDKVMATARVDGNAEFATELSFIFRNLRWDVEEDLSRVVGDIAAHRIVQGAGNFVGWQAQAGRRLGENLAEYLALESRLLVGAQEFAAFKDEVVRLNAALATLEKRARL
ncbi:MAG: hypothetical protein AB1642_12125 [Pseudomonadota bacterium]